MKTQTVVGSNAHTEQATKRVIAHLEAAGRGSGRAVSDLFADFCALTRITLQQEARRYMRQHAPSDLGDVAWQANFDKHEQVYLDIAKRHSSEALKEMAAALGELQMAVRQADGYGYNDWLGDIYMSTVVSNAKQKWNGTFFTPFHLCVMMAQMTIDDAEAECNERVTHAMQRAGLPMATYDSPEAALRTNYDTLAPHLQPITVCEPACGSGAMVIAFASVAPRWAIELGLYRFTCIDIDPVCADMCMIQCWLYGLHAEVYCADALTMPMVDRLPEPHRSHALRAEVVRAETLTKKAEAVERVKQERVGQLKLFESAIALPHSIRTDVT